MIKVFLHRIVLSKFFLEDQKVSCLSQELSLVVVSMEPSDKFLPLSIPQLER
jgi:hypothetical protein